MYCFSKNEKDILKLAYNNLSENSTHRNTFLMKNSEFAVYINALRSLAREGYIKPISDNFFDSTLSLKYEYDLTSKGESVAESLT
jgi:hypothetical protein